MSDQIITVESLQVGQQVVIAHRHGQQYTVENITKITKTQIVTDSGKRFSKKSGDVVGEHASKTFTYHWLAREFGCWWKLLSVDQMNEINRMGKQEQERKSTVRLIKEAVNDGKLQNLSAADLQIIVNMLGLEN